MGRSPNRYLDEPRLYELATSVVASMPLQNGWAIAGGETIFRPEGGGQPQDHGTVELMGQSYTVSGMHKANGKIFLHLPDLKEGPEEGTTIAMSIDSNRRNCLSKLHTLQHMFSATLHQVLPDVAIVDTGIMDDATGAWITIQHDIQQREPLQEIEHKVQTLVLSDAPVTTKKMKSLKHCEAEYGSMFRSDKAGLSGKVRIVVVEGIDANPCSGTHWNSSNVGPYELELLPGEEEYTGCVRMEFCLRDAEER